MINEEKKYKVLCKRVITLAPSGIVLIPGSILVSRGRLSGYVRCGYLEEITDGVVTPEVTPEVEPDVTDESDAPDEPDVTDESDAPDEPELIGEDGPAPEIKPGSPAAKKAAKKTAKKKK